MDFLPILLGLVSTALPLVLEVLSRRAHAKANNLVLTIEELDQATRVLREEFSRTRTPGPGGADDGSSTSTITQTPAELEALAIMRVYSKDLMAEANRIAKRASAERPSKEHVRLAADRIGLLRDRAGVVSDLALAIGAILIGAAVSYQIHLWTGGRAQDGMGLWMTVTLAVGVGLTVAAVFLKWRRS
jgi:hypothetical protein